jgi:hypothetical protein
MASYTTHLTEPGKTRQSSFLNWSVWFFLSWLYFKFRIFRFPILDVLISTGKFPTASFWGISIKPFPLPPLEAAGSTNENTHPKAFVSSPLHLLMSFG